MSTAVPLTLTPTQTEILTLAAARPDGKIEPLPPQLRGGARTRVIHGLQQRGLIVQAAADAPYCLSDAGYAALGRRRPKPRNAQEKKVEAPARRSRPDSKQAQVIAMLQRPAGATIAQICSATGWQAHTVRGAFAGTFKKKLGLDIVSEKPEQGDRIYRLP